MSATQLDPTIYWGKIPNNWQFVPINPYYGYLLREMALQGFIQASCSAVRERAPRIRFSDFSVMLLPLPPLEEQQGMKGEG